ncbi:MAG: hypothetical protein A3G81_34475 [Betaproteobacteria bacterium RIFCSPLOWO2_12_FULL_65_14]|nr:MAG: hypothetical protein A3G81_34475 [Betaproteobacteria bacterium RIFCSPLOWO2_12_FULL_65_14]
MLGLALEVRDHAARFGAERAARYLAWRVADRLAGYMPYQGLLLPASRARGRNAFAPNRLVCREVALQELAPYTSDSAYDLSERFLSDARARADCCIGVFAGEKLVSYSFNSRVPTNIDSGFRYEFPEGWVYHFKAFTLPEWRGQGLHSRQMSAILNKFAGLACFKGLTTLVVTTNYASLASFARLYFEPVFRFAIVGKGEKRRVVADGHSFREGFAVAKLGASNGGP